jgi:hypothetical protein
VFDGSGARRFDIADVRAHLQYPGCIDLGCRIDNGDLQGFAGIPAVNNGVLGLPPLPYRALYRYSKTPTGAAKVMKLEALRGAETSHGLKSGGPDGLLDAATAAPKGDIISFGRPVADDNGTHVYFWYSIQQRSNAARIISIFACNDGQTTRPLTGYIVNRRSVLVWDDGNWKEIFRQRLWKHQTQTGLVPGPVVGLDANRAVIVYRPPRLFRIQRIK